MNIVEPNEKEFIKAAFKMLFESDPSLLQDGIFAGKLTHIVGDNFILTLTPSVILVQHTTTSDNQREFEKRIIRNLTQTVVSVGEGDDTSTAVAGLCEYDNNNFNLFQVEDRTVFAIAEPMDICSLFTNSNDTFLSLCANVCELSADIQERFKAHQHQRQNSTHYKVPDVKKPTIKENDFFDPTLDQPERKYS